MKKRDAKNFYRLKMFAGGLALGGLFLFGTAENAWAQMAPKIVVTDSSGEFVVDGNSFSDVADSLDGNRAVLYDDVTESAAVEFSGEDVSFSITSSDGTTKRISLLGDEAFFHLTTNSNNTLTLDLSGVKFASSVISSTGGNVTLTGDATIFTLFGRAIESDQGILINGTFDFQGGSGSAEPLGAIAGGTGDIYVYGKNTFQQNVSGESGGAIYSSDANVLLYGENIFRANTADGAGGAIYSAGGGITLSGKNTFHGNTSQGNGGAFAVEGDTVTISGVNVFFGNSSDINGGAIATGSGSITFWGNGSTATFTGNIYSCHFKIQFSPATRWN
ncbi:MAG: hypothetical protein Q4C96_10795, partial [Planctomycetia bacterium]|nr:hypothetical protein [Planctomycetia bacterium]